MYPGFQFQKFTIIVSRIKTSELKPFMRQYEHFPTFQKKCLPSLLDNTIMKKNLFLASCLIIYCGLFSLQAQTKSIENGNGSGNQNHLLCGGVERWSVKVLTDPLTSTIDFTPINISLQNFVTLSTPFANPYMNRSAGVEDKIYKIICHITIKKDESDNDFHLVLSDSTNTFIGEIPDPACSAAASSIYVNQFIAARNFVNTNIASGNIYNVNIGSVTVIGVAFIDPPHGQTGAAPNHLELHPILDIYFTPAEGITQIDKKVVEVAIGPNPFSNNTSIKVVSKLNNLKDCSLKLFNAEGMEVKDLKLPVSNNNQIDYSLNRGGFKTRNLYLPDY